MGLYFKENIFKTAAVTTIMILAICTVQAETYEQYIAKKQQAADDQRHAIEVTGGTAVISGGISYRNFKEAKVVKDAAAQNIMEATGTLKIMSNDEIRNVSTAMIQGDEIHLKFELSEAASRQYRIRELENAISNERASASSYRAMAASALIPQTETYTDAEGHTQTRPGSPNYGAYAMYNSMADSAEQSAVEYGEKLGAVKAGAPIELVVQESALDSAKLGLENVKGEMFKISNNGSKMMKVSRVPREAVLQARRLNRAGALAAGVGVVSAAIAGEEVIWSAGSEKLRDIVDSGQLPFAQSFGTNRAEAKGDGGAAK